MYRHAFPTIGTHFTLTVWDAADAAHASATFRECESICTEFDALYSRFIPTSLVTSLATRTGVHQVPHDLVAMLRIYEQLQVPTNGKINPCIGNTIADLGYDALYSLTPQDVVRKTPHFRDALRIVDDTHIELLQPTLLDLGALGKGYLIDKVYNLLRDHGYTQYLVDGSGDIRYASEGVPLRCALEDPRDPAQAIGVKTITAGALCASALGRRAWPGTHGTTLHHYIDPDTSLPTSGVIATWVYADTAVWADALASALFFATTDAAVAASAAGTVPPFSYALLAESPAHALERKNSADFAEFFS